MKEYSEIGGRAYALFGPEEKESTNKPSQTIVPFEWQFNLPIAHRQHIFDFPIQNLTN